MGADEDGQGVAVATWEAPPATLVLPFDYPDEIEVRVLDERDDARLVGIVGLISPRNKDRPESRRAFAAKCASYLQRGVGVVVVDLVTTRLSDLHDELVSVLRLDDKFRRDIGSSLSVLAYRPIHVGGQDRVEKWVVPVEVGGRCRRCPWPCWATG